MTTTYEEDGSRHSSLDSPQFQNRSQDAEALRQLREPFPTNRISQLPKPTKKENTKGNCRECGKYHGLPAVHIDYVGHADLTERLLDVDPWWNWEPFSTDVDGLPAIINENGESKLWIRLTVAGLTRIGVGTCPAGKHDAEKELIGDALRNAAMRFGAALDLWSKSEKATPEEPVAGPVAQADPDSEAQAQGWASAEYRSATLTAFREEAKAWPDNIREAMKEKKAAMNLDGAPTRQQYLDLEAELQRLISTTSPSEAPRPTEPAPTEPEGETPPMTQSEAQNAVESALPGSKDVTPATPEMVQAVELHLDWFKENQDKASTRAFNKFAKEKKFPSKLKDYTAEQVGEALDFIETL